MTTELALTVDELLSTTRSVRKRLDLDRPVPRELLVECIQLAIQAPNSCNAQRTRFLIVQEPHIRARLAELYRRSYADYAKGDFRAGNLLTGDTAWDDAQQRIETSTDHLCENLHRVPVLVIPCQQVDPGDERSREAQAVLWGSAVPAAWSFCLAARSRGLGTTWTTLHLRHEKEAAAILNIPYDTVQQVALIPVAYTKGTDFKPAYRLPVEEIITFIADVEVP
ncbi:nitroreductase family protein [Actinomadura rubrisoli]|uniref:Nitroreductase family protein n=1 Tax=Actinomadura rubrisoli TaxID=2530368 RepID=A0A4R5APQ3_9ACTN|nr:nitroreductase family protein [Actinomadura rubrisoli]TDD73669.1 nitroreductase family protein [Actinomadura rubrisoli]